MTAAKFSTYDQIGIAEDVSDKISMISPTDTPFQTSVKTGPKPHNKVVSWQEDELASVADNKHVEGADAPAASQTATTMRTNYTQILSKTVKVTGTSQAMKLYGRKSELAHQLYKKGKEVKRDLEYVLVGLDTAAVAGDDTSTPRQMASAYPQIDASATNDHSAASLNETVVRTTIREVFENGAEAKVLMIKPSDADNVAAFAKSIQGSDAPATIRDFGSSQTVVNAVSVYVTPWGTVRVSINRFIHATKALVFDPDMWELRWLRKWNRTKLAVTGDSESHQLLGEVTLCHMNQKASGLIENIA